MHLPLLYYNNNFYQKYKFSGSTQKKKLHFIPEFRIKWIYILVSFMYIQTVETT